MTQTPRPPPPPPPMNFSDIICDLERGLCGWSNTQSHLLDHLDWELSNLLFETHYPTPPCDHTLLDKKGFSFIIFYLVLPNEMYHPRRAVLYDFVACIFLSAVILFTNIIV